MKKIITISSISTVLLGLVTSFIYDGIKDLPWLSSFKNFFYWLWNDIFCAEFKVWQIIAFILVAFVVLLIFAKFKNGNIVEPKFKSYTQDRIAGFNWTWRWIWNNRQNAWNPDMISPLCKKCDTRMHYNYKAVGSFGAYQAQCPRCDETYFDIKAYDDIAAIIIDNCRKNNL